MRFANEIKKFRINKRLTMTVNRVVVIGDLISKKWECFAIGVELTVAKAVVIISLRRQSIV